MEDELLKLTNVSVKMAGHFILTGLNLTIRKNEQWAIVGPSGSGKTSLAQCIMGIKFYSGMIEMNLPGNGEIAFIEQQHHFKNLSNTSNFYYQQRYNSLDAEDSYTVAQYLNHNFAANWEVENSIVKKLHLELLLQKPLIQLSNGENKRLQLAKALLNTPSLLILDNPFIGLDISGRKILHQIINDLIKDGVHIILITTANELPAAITHVGVMESGELKLAIEKDEYKQMPIDSTHVIEIDKALLNRLYKPTALNKKDIIVMKDVSINYGEKKVLTAINWRVETGEHWSISGPNGSGKSTLLSLVYGDNPQAYCNEIYLFGRRRGTGESIWDIKRPTGYVSPELHLFFDRSTNCFDAVASGLFDTIGLFKQLNERQQQIVNDWMRLFELDKVKNKLLFQLSIGEQRMVMLARALVKSPSLLILDEPCQGLDDHHTRYLNQLIEEIYAIENMTLLYVSHYAADIPNCVDRFLRLG